MVVSFSTAPLCANGGDLCEPDNGELLTGGWQTSQLPPLFSRPSHMRRQEVDLPCCISVNGEKGPTFCCKLVVGLQENSGDLRKVDDSELVTAHSRVPQLPPNFIETFTQ